MEGIPIPTSVPAVPTEWNHVKKELRLWAFNGGCQIGSYSDKSKPDFMKKVLQCTRCLSYRPTRPHKFDQNGLREGTKLKEIRQKKKRHAKQKRGIRPAHVRVGKEGTGLCTSSGARKMAPWFFLFFCVFFVFGVKLNCFFFLITWF